MNPKATPLYSPPAKLLNVILELNKHGCIKKGINEVTKSLNNGNSQLVVIAADTEPFEVILHLPMLCEDKNVKYVFVESSEALGKAAGINKAAVVTIISQSEVEYKRNLRMITEVGV